MLLTSAKFVSINFKKIPGYIKKLESKSAKVKDGLNILLKVGRQLSALPISEERQRLTKYFIKRVMNNPGLTAIRKYASPNQQITDKMVKWEPEDLNLARNAPVANDDIEGVFSVSKAFYRANRMAFNFDNLRLKLIAKNILKKVKLLL